MRNRKSVSKDAETRLLVESRRRCCLCFSLEGDLAPKRVQIAHISRDRSDSEYENLVVLCLPHHDEYDSTTSQSKGFTPQEVRYWKLALVEQMQKVVQMPDVITMDESRLPAAGGSNRNEGDASKERKLPVAIEVTEIDGRLFVTDANNTRTELFVDGQIAHPVLSPDRTKIAFLRSSTRPKVEVGHGLAGANDIWIVDVDGRNARCLVQSRAHTDMQKVLAGLQTPQFSPDGSLLFLSHAWVTSHAVHRLDFRTGEVSFVCPGNSLHVVASGDFTGYLVVQQHRYFWGGGSYDWYWLVTPEGKPVEPVGAEPNHLVAFLEMTSERPE